MKFICKKAMTLIILAVFLTGCGMNQVYQERQSMELDNLGEISVCVREEGSGTGETFARLVANSDDSTAICYEANGNREVLEYVCSQKNAIGYISKETSFAGQQCKAVSTEKKYKRPLLLIFTGGLNDVEADFMRYLKSQVDEEYAPFFSNKSQGTIKIGGADSALSMIQKIADEYVKINDNASVTVVATNSADGINGVLNGEYDYGMVSRYLTYDEQEILKAKKIAEDEIIIIVNQKNPITYLSTKELRDIYSGKITSWKMLKGEPLDEKKYQKLLGDGKR